MDDKAATLHALEEEWRVAVLAKDEVTLRRLIHPDFRLVGVRPSGEPISIDLDHWIAARVGMDIVALEFDLLETVGDDHALVGTLDARWTVRFMHQCIDERVLLTDVWLRDGDAWRVVRRHTSFVPSPGTHH